MKCLTEENALLKLSSDPKGLTRTFISLPSASCTKIPWRGQLDAAEEDQPERKTHSVKYSARSDGIELEQRGAAVCASDISWDPNGWEEQRYGRDGSQD